MYFFIGSPFTCLISETARVLLPTEGMEKVAVGRTTAFVVEAESSLGSPVVQVLSPTRKPLHVDYTPVGGNKSQITFTPEDVGEF